MTNTQSEAERYGFFNMAEMARSMVGGIDEYRLTLRIGPWIPYYCCQAIP